MAKSPSVNRCRSDNIRYGRGFGIVTGTSDSIPYQFPWGIHEEWVYRGDDHWNGVIRSLFHASSPSGSLLDFPGEDSNELHGPGSF